MHTPIRTTPARSFRATLLFGSICPAILLAALVSRSVQADSPAPPQYPNFPSETPTNFIPVTNTFDYVKTEPMIPMVQLLTM